MSAEVTFLHSLHNLTGVGWNRIESLGYTLADHTKFAADAGYNGIELSPTRRIVREVTRGEISDQEFEQVGALGQSFRGEKGLVGLLSAVQRNPDRTLNLIGAFLQYPYISDVRLLTAVQRRRPNIPVIIQDIEDNYLAHKKTPLQNKVLIVTPDTVEELGVENINEVGPRAGDKNFNLCLDPTYQMRRLNKRGQVTPLNDLRVALPILWPHTKLVHLSLGRKDLPGYTDSQNDLKDVFLGNQNSAVGEILAQLGIQYERFSKRPPLVVQVMSTGVAELLGKTTVSLGDVNEVLTKVRENTAKMMHI